ncbi:MAG TPA: ATP-binding protein, partial [Longimicrobiales bacterium]|nr:ATP-binding protein [Longimicrobiales bacterium]
MTRDSEPLRVGEHSFTATDLLEILNGVRDGISVQGPTGQLLYVNPAAARVSGFDSPAAMLAAPLSKITAPYDLFDLEGNPLNVTELPGRKALTGEKESALAVRVRERKTGRETVSVISAQPIFDAHGKVRFAVNIWHDITEQIRRQELIEINASQVEEVAAELESTVEELKEKTEEANQAREHAEYMAARHSFLAEAGKLLAASLEVEATLRMIMHLAVPKIADWASISLLENGKLKQLEVAHFDPEKLRFALELQKKYPPDDEGSMRVLRTGKSELYSEIPDELLAQGARDAEHLNILRQLELKSAMVVPLIVRDEPIGVITFIGAESGRRYNEEDLEFAESLAARSALAVQNARLYNKADDANRTKADFLAVMSHELRTPLTAVFGYTELLSTGVTGPVTPEQIQQLGRIRSSASHLLGIIEDILNYARTEAGKEVVTADKVQLSEIVREAVSMVLPAARDKQLALEHSVKNDCVLDTDRIKLRQILVNLLGNAVKFTDHGAVGLEADCEDNKTAVIIVHDTGPGIPAEDLDRIFEPFRQLQSATTRTQGGTGLGLAVTRRFVDLLGGTISIDS